MTITDKQIERRRNYLGSSDMPGILGMNPEGFSTAIDIWNKKVYDIEQREGSEAMKRGQYLEQGMLDFAADKTGLKIMPNQFRVKGIFGANCDGIGYEREKEKIVWLPIGFEAKTTSMWEGWGDEGTDQVPEYVACQVHHQMYCGDFEKVYIPVLLPAFGRLQMKLYLIERDEEVIANMVRIGTEWWEKYVVGLTPPPHMKPAKYEILKLIRREPKKVIDFPVEAMQFVDEWDAAKAQETMWKKNKERARDTIVEVLGNAEGATLPDNNGQLTYLRQHGADAIDLQALKDKYPDIYKEIATPNEFPVLRLKGRKKNDNSNGQ